MQSQDFLSVALSLGLILFCTLSAHVIRGNSFDAFRITLTLFCFFGPCRAFFLATQLDELFTEDLARDRTDLLPICLLLAAVWIVVFVITYVCFRPISTLGRWLLPPPPATNKIPQLSLINVCLLVLCLLTTAFIASKAGGLGAMPSFLKQERQGAGLYPLRQFGNLGLFTSGACVLYYLREGRIAKYSLALSILFAGLTFLWGGREVIATFMLFMIGGLSLYTKTSKTLVIGVCSVATLVLVLMSYWRAQMIAPELVENQKAPIVRRVAVSMHMVRFDALVLSYDHFQRLGSFRNGEDFKNGFIESIPRAIWAKKPEVTKFGHALRLQFNDRAKNGWPVDTFAIWYINFGLAGIVLGAFLSGLIVCCIDNRYNEIASNPLCLAMTLILSIEVFQGGLSEGTPPAVILWVIPMTIIMTAISWFNFPVLRPHRGLG